jgi:import inner membrane translocase subunit TIM23
MLVFLGPQVTLDYLLSKIVESAKTNRSICCCNPSGIVFGGGFGLIQGYRNSPSTKFRIRLNSVLNGSGRGGSKAGNALGVLAIFYSTAEWTFDKLEVERLAFGADFVTPLLAGATTGAAYMSTRGPKTIALAAVLGAMASGSHYTAGKFVPAYFPQLAFFF